MAANRRIAVLGGGMGGLSAAYEIVSREPTAEITVFQMGWRLGGKCASSRNTRRCDRIEEHGIHLFLGCYENAFDLIGRVYRDLGRDWQDAFEPQDTFTLFELNDGKWEQWDFEMPTLPGKPGDRLDADDSPRIPTLLEVATAIIDWVRSLIADHFHADPKGLDPILSVLRGAVDLLTDHLDVDDLNRVIGLFDKLFGLVKKVAGFVGVDPSPGLRKLLVLTELGLAAAIGLLRALVGGVPLSDLDGMDLTEWLDRNALGGKLSDDARRCTALRMIYEASFAFEDGDPAKPNFAAGSAIRTVLRLLLDYRGHCFYKMKRGTAETLATPLYQALAKRNVRFEFFHRVDEITLTADGRNVAAVTFAVQSKATSGSYDPFVRTDCWPDRPKYELLENGAELQQSDELEDGGYDLEDPRSTPPKRYADRTIHWRGDKPNETDVFDAVVLAIPPAASKHACRAFTQSPRVGDKWRTMYGAVASTPTQASQLWFDVTDEQMGWRRNGGDPALIGCYEQPFSNWADFSATAAYENWPMNVVGNVAYLCGPLVEDGDLKTYDPARWRQIVRTNVDDWLMKHGTRLWPALFPQKQFDWRRLVDLAEGHGHDRFAAQFFRANLSPSGRYVLSLKGTIASRLRPGESGFGNLWLAGDWTLNGANNGCVEGTVMSGRQATRGLLGLSPVQLPVHGEAD
jgi:uncharacterized protein with NAD-binding domain and iron-sulfur cluster